MKVGFNDTLMIHLVVVTQKTFPTHNRIVKQNMFHKHRHALVWQSQSEQQSAVTSSGDSACPCKTEEARCGKLVYLVLDAIESVVEVSDHYPK